MVHSSFLVCSFSWQLKLRIIAIQNAPRENRRNPRPLRGNLEDALDHFEQIDSRLSIGRSHLELLLPRYTVPAELLENLSKNFQSILISLGRVVCGDEKLYDFTDDSEFNGLIPVNQTELASGLKNWYLWYISNCKWPRSPTNFPWRRPSCLSGFGWISW